MYVTSWVRVHSTLKSVQKMNQRPESLSSLCTKEARGSGHARRSPVQTRTPVLEAGFDLTSRKCTQRDGIILTW